MADVTHNLSPALCRAARGLLGWSQGELAERANVARSTVTDFERGTRIPVRNNLAAIQEAFEQAGVEIIPQNGGGAGVRFRKPV